MEMSRTKLPMENLSFKRKNIFTKIKMSIKGNGYQKKKVMKF